MPTVTPSGNNYKVTFAVGYSRCTAVSLMKSKGKEVDSVKDYLARSK